MAADGVADPRRRSRYRVTGNAWFDHQWGDFISVGGGGWDWFAVNLDDGTDLTLSLVRDADGSYPLVYGTLVAPDGRPRHLTRDAFTVDVDRSLDEPGDRRRLPGGWRIDDPGEELVIDLAADGRRPGARHARDDRGRLLGGVADGQPRGATGSRSAGEAYVELTGYAPTGAGAPRATSRERAAAARRRRWPRGHATRRRGR